MAMILIAHVWYGPWESLLHMLPIWDQMKVKYRPGRYVLGSRLPQVCTLILHDIALERTE